MSSTIARGRNAASAARASRSVRAGSIWNALPREILLVEQQRLGGVLDDQDRQCARVDCPARGGAGTADVVDRSGSSAVNVEPDARRALDRDAAAEQLGQLAAQRQAEAGALDAALQRAVDLRELLEDPLLVLGRDADAGVGHRERHGVAVRGAARAETRTSPRSVNLSAFEMKLRRICETLPSSV